MPNSSRSASGWRRGGWGLAVELPPLRADLFAPPPRPGDQLRMFRARPGLG